MDVRDRATNRLFTDPPERGRTIGTVSAVAGLVSGGGALLSGAPTDLIGRQAPCSASPSRRPCLATRPAGDDSPRMPRYGRPARDEAPGTPRYDGTRPRYSRAAWADSATSRASARSSSSAAGMNTTRCWPGVSATSSLV